MKAMRHAVAAGLLIGLGACSGMSGGGSSSHTAAATQPTVAPALVRQVQSRLRDGGYYKQGAVDGVWGSETETAVRSFQHDHNLSSNGQLDVPTLQALNIGPAAAGTAPTQPMSPTNPAPAANTVAPSTTAPAATTPDNSSNSGNGTPLNPNAPR